jgi:hypothetical protein
VTRKCDVTQFRCNDISILYLSDLIWPVPKGLTACLVGRRAFTLAVAVLRMTATRVQVWDRVQRFVHEAEA